MAGNRGTRPLMIYTSLIFIVAIIMVIVAFFGQKHLEKLQIRQTETTLGISERASQLSDENRLLMENNKQLTNENSELMEEKIALALENENIKKENEAFKKLSEAYIMIASGNKQSARNILAEIYTEDLTSEQKEVYSALVKSTK